MVNFRQHNHIKLFRDFIHNIAHILSPNSYMRCIFFIYRKIQNACVSNLPEVQRHTARKVNLVENGVVPMILLFNLIYDIIGSEINLFLKKKIVTFPFEDAWLNVSGLTAHNRFTYSSAKKVKIS